MAIKNILEYLRSTKDVFLINGDGDLICKMLVTNLYI